MHLINKSTFFNRNNTAYKISKTITSFIITRENTINITHINTIILSYVGLPTAYVETSYQCLKILFEENYSRGTKIRLHCVDNSTYTVAICRIRTDASD